MALPYNEYKQSEQTYRKSGSLMPGMLYGYTSSLDAPNSLVRLINKVMAEFSKAVIGWSLVGAWMVNLTPWLRYLPDWVPGTSLKKTAWQWRKDSDGSINVSMRLCHADDGKRYH